jgi:hypothetical protein
MRSARRLAPQHLFSVTPHLRQESEDHGRRRLVLLQVDQQLSEGARHRVAPELADPLGPPEVGERKVMEAIRREEPAQGRPGAYGAGCDAVGVRKG